MRRWLGAAMVSVLLGGCAAVSALLATGGIDRSGPSSLALALVATLVAIVVAVAAAYLRSGRSLWRILASPLAIAAATWLLLFVVRPTELYFEPRHVALALGELGFKVSDLTRTVAIGGLGCAAWLGGYLVGLGRPRTAEVPERPSPRLSVKGSAIVLALGTLLWLALFVRQGGLSALARSPAAIRTTQQGSFYGFVGVWLVQGAALCAFWTALQSSSRTARRVLLVSVPVIVLTAVTLQIRALAGFTVVAAIVAFVALRSIGRRTIVLLAAIGVVGALTLGAFQQFRAYTNTVPVPEAARLTLHTPLSAMYVSDLSTYDHFVAMQELVPGAIPYLGGRTLLEIPAAFVPRSLWPGKPLGIDREVASYLYPGVVVGVPIAMQGEFYWNGGIGVVAGGALVLGLLFGIVARFGLRTPPRSPAFLLYAVTLPFTYALLTRGLAVMLLNVAFAITGVSIALLAMIEPSPAPVLARRVRAGARRLAAGAQGGDVP